MRKDYRENGTLCHLEVANACEAIVVGVIDMKGEQGGDCLLPLLISRV